ncbi:hypothetical protein WHI96_07875 [Pseudonocardia tropica]|uniref:C1q domain-containing protein n=1 Tax=Pseudonocardia tropica TaxID=681289 RepID=A0ABV1JS17_9PSEU
MADQRRFDTLEQTAARTAQQLAEDTSTIYGRLATHTHPEYAPATHTHAPLPFAHYRASAAGSYTTNGVMQKLVLPNAINTDPSIYQYPDATGYYFYEAGVYRITAGVITSGGVAAQTRYLCLADVTDVTNKRYVMADGYCSGAGGSFSVSVERYFDVGGTVCSAIASTGSGAAMTVNTGNLAATFISISRVRS